MSNRTKQRAANRKAKLKALRHHKRRWKQGGSNKGVWAMGKTRGTKKKHYYS